MFSATNFKFVSPGEVRTRFAPSPTGFLHVGGARTALFNYIFAEKNKGSFIIRIEDTDKERSSNEFEKDIIESLKWLGIKWTEGPDIGGSFGPYRQSERGYIYKEYLEKLLNEEKAYRCFCSPEDLEAQRQYSISQGKSWIYNGKCSQLSTKEVKEKIKNKVPFIFRFKTPSHQKIVFEDLIKGKTEFDTNLIGDFSIAKSDFSPLYNFAAAIDDFEMKISYVIRAEDHLSNTPKQILIQKALNLSTAHYAHLPLILGPDRSKLSKRHGAMAVSEFRKQGYLPEALINFMAFLGWNPGKEREIYSLPSLISEFSLDKVQKSGAIFNIKKLDFLNGFYIRQKSIEKLTELCLPYFLQKNDFDYLKKITKIYQERIKKLSEITDLTDFFFKEKLKYDKDLLRWKGAGDKEIKEYLDIIIKILSKVEEKKWNKINLEKILIDEAQKFLDKGKLLWPFRVALTGKKASAAPFEIAEILGKEKTIQRIKEAEEIIDKKSI